VARLQLLAAAGPQAQQLAADGLADLVELRDDHLLAGLHTARSAGGIWSRRQGWIWCEVQEKQG
jgi:hypothetical protein